MNKQTEWDIAQFISFGLLGLGIWLDSFALKMSATIYLGFVYYLSSKNGRPKS